MTYYTDDHVTLHAGDCLDVLATLPDASVDAVVTDPPYGLEFMGRDWDTFKTGRGEKYAAGGSLDADAIASRSGKGGAGPSYVDRPAKRCGICGKQAWSGSPCKCPEPHWVMDNSPLLSFQAWCELWAAECLRVLRPGGHMLAFGGTRTSHRLACAIEDAGFEIRDSIGYGSGMLAWVYGSGFPKSRNVSADPTFCQRVPGVCDPATDEAAESAAQVLLADLRGSGQTDAAGVEGLHGLPVHLYPDYALPGSTKQDVFAGVRGAGNVASEEGSPVTEGPARNGSLLDVRNAGQAVPEQSPTGGGDLLLASVRGDGEDGEPPSARLRRNGDEAGAALRGGQPGMERRRDVQARQGELPWPAVRPLSPGVVSDEPEGRLHHGAPSSHGAVGGPDSPADGSGQPHQPQPAGQPSGEPGALPEQRGPQAGRGWPVCSGCSKPRIPLGLGTALKPAWEPIVVARKPLVGTVAANILQHGTGALNVDGCRVGTGGGTTRSGISDRLSPSGAFTTGHDIASIAAGRWPANVILDEDQAAALDQQSGTLTSGALKPYRERHVNASSYQLDRAKDYTSDADTGGASRFFFIAREDSSCTTTPLEDSSNAANDADGKPKSTTPRTLEPGASTTGPPTTPIETLDARFRYVAKADSAERPRVNGTSHPTVKPLALMRWLVRLVTPPGGTVLEPFAGSGTTVEACVLEGFKCIAIEREAEYLPLITSRLQQGTFDFELPTPRPAPQPDDTRAGEASADRRYTDRGGSNFAMKPGRRYRDAPPVATDPDDGFNFGEGA